MQRILLFGNHDFYIDILLLGAKGLDERERLFPAQASRSRLCIAQARAAPMARSSRVLSSMQS